MAAQGKPRGRPRGFDRAAALRAAMQTFWRLGFEGASMAELTRAMAINAPSLYAAFGSKEGLFREAVCLYLETEDCESRNILAREPTARAAIRAMLRHSARSLTRSDSPRGCLLILGDANAAAQNDGVHRHLAAWRREVQTGLEQRLRRGVVDGDVPPQADVKAIAAFYMTVLQGLSLQARDGASREAMLRVADAAMAAWDNLVAQSAEKRSLKARKTARTNA